MKRRFSLIIAIISAVILALAYLLCLQGVKPFPSLIYLLVWYPYILIVDHMVYRRKGASLLMSRPGELLVMLIWSAGFWTFFEGINLRLLNWVYVGVEPVAALRYGLGILCFATVLPGVFETMEFLDTTRLFSRVRTRHFSVGPLWPAFMFAMGIIFLVLPLLWPRYFFPLVWGSVALLVEPLVYRASPDRSLLRDLSQGQPRRLILLLLAGLICGAVWESFNFYAAMKWQYQVPFVGDIKIFEMPLLGYFGFPPFAVECWIMYAALLLARDRLHSRTPRFGGTIYVISALVFTGLMAWLVFPKADKILVKSFRDESILKSFSPKKQEHPSPRSD